MRLISFPTGLGCSHFPPVFLFSLPYKVGRFFTEFPFIKKQLPRSTELASKKEGNFNVMVTRSWHVTTHMICSHDPDTWPTNFILTSSHHWYHHPRHHPHVITTSGSFICHTTTTSFHQHGTRLPSSKNLVWASSKML